MKRWAYIARLYRMGVAVWLMWVWSYLYGMGGLFFVWVWPHLYGVGGAIVATQIGLGKLCIPSFPGSPPTCSKNVGFF